MIRPKRKSDTIVSVRLDRRDLAMLSRVMDKEGYVFVSKSTMVRMAVESVVDHWVEAGKVRLIETTEEALEVLGGRFRNLNPGGRGQRNLVRNLEQDCREAESGFRLRHLEESMRIARMRDPDPEMEKLQRELDAEMGGRGREGPVFDVEKEKARVQELAQLGDLKGIVKKEDVVSKDDGSDEEEPPNFDDF